LDEHDLEDVDAEEIDVMDASLEKDAIGEERADLDDDEGDDEERRASFVRRHAGAVLAVLSSLVALGLVVAFFVVFAFGLSSIQEQRNQKLLYGSLRGLLSPSSAVAPWTGGKIPLGAPVALVTSSAGGLHDVVIVQGTSSDQMSDGPGHLADSPLPGQVGDAVLIGRSSTTGAPFGHVVSLRKGAAIVITTGQGTFHFRVEDARLAGAKLPKIPPSGSLVTLVTSSGPGALGNVVDGHLVYVDAALIGQAVPTPHGQPKSVSASEIQGRGDLAALPFVLAWLGALVVSVLASMWLLGRWGWRRSWLFIAPVGLGVLWGLSDQLLRLVPNVT
jgi:sortase A